MEIPESRIFGIQPEVQFAVGNTAGRIISPILANIYLHEFDKFMEGISAEYTKGKQRRPYREYQILQYKRNRAKKKGNQEQADEYLRQMQNIPALDPMDKTISV